jgi:hypothetical protein
MFNIQTFYLDGNRYIPIFVITTYTILRADAIGEYPQRVKSLRQADCENIPEIEVFSQVGILKASIWRNNIRCSHTYLLVSTSASSISAAANMPAWLF